MKRRLFTMLTACVMALCMSCPAFASAYTLKDATNTALKDAGLTAGKVYKLEAEKDDGEYEVEFRQIGTNTEFEYDISRSGKILEKSVKYSYTPIKSKKKISRKSARKIVAKASGIKYRTVKKGTCKYCRKAKVGYYRIKFCTKKYKFEYKLLAKTGKIIKYKYEKRHK